MNSLEYKVPSGMCRKAAQPQTCQYGGSLHGCSQVKTVEITHYPSTVVSVLCSDVDNGDVFPDIACTAGSNKTHFCSVSL